jgi:hypothetical protein
VECHAIGHHFAGEIPGKSGGSAAVRRVRVHIFPIFNEEQARSSGSCWMRLFWSAVICHRFDRLAGLPARQSRVQRLAETPRARQCDGDKSPAESADR